MFFNKPNNHLKNRKIGLDVLRAMAILIVVHTHAHVLFPNGELNFPVLIVPDGVGLFFVLSGYLIGSIIYKEFVIERMRFKSVFGFYKRRWFRTLPNYYLFLGLNFFLAYIGFTANNADGYNWKFLFFLQNFYHGFQGPFLESWSLSVEEWFYMFFPLVLFLFFILLPRKVAFLSTALFFIVFSFTLRILRQYWQAPLDDYWYNIEIIKTAVNRFDAIGWGILAVYFTFEFKISLKFARILFLIALPILALKLVYLGFAPNPFMNSVKFTIEPFIVMFFLPYLSMADFRQNIITRFFTWISKISYSMYLLHLSILIPAVVAIFDITHENGNRVYAIYWLMCLAISTLIYHFFEKPMTNLRDKL